MTPKPAKLAACTQGSFQLHDLEPELEDFLDAVVTGLSRPQKTLPCKFFYDERGSALFDQICRLDEYYPTRTEIGILERCARELNRELDQPQLLVEYGSGSSVKVRALLDNIDICAYMPVDISREHMVMSAERLQESYPELDIIAVCADYSQPFEIPEYAENPDIKRLGFFPGSSIGNFGRDEAIGFLGNVAQQLRYGDGLIVGVDLKKDTAVLHAAYDDREGITAAFNRNLLARINRELGGNFDLERFRHRAEVNEVLGRVEMHLESLADQRALIGEHEFVFRAGETIHTENSYKYNIDEFQAMAHDAGFEPIRCWTDPNRWFSVHYLEQRI